MFLFRLFWFFFAGIIRLISTLIFGTVLLTGAVAGKELFDEHKKEVQTLWETVLNLDTVENLKHLGGVVIRQFEQREEVCSLSDHPDH